MRAKEKQLLDILSESKDWMPGNILSKRLGVTERTIRNYVKNLNVYENKIQSSQKGYLLVENLNEKAHLKNKSTPREEYVLSKLLINAKVNVFDLADALAVSDSLVLSKIIPNLKTKIRKFNLKIVTHDYNISLQGDERSKRRLISSIVTKNTYGYANSIGVLKSFFPNAKIKNISKKIYQLCQQDTNLSNDYSENNLMIHLLIMYLRLSMGYSLQYVSPSINMHLQNVIRVNKNIKYLSNQFIKLFESSLNKKISEQDKNQIILLILLSLNHDTSLRKLVDTKFSNAVKSILKKLADKYYIDNFDTSFLDDLTFHVFMAKQRAEHNYSYPDPLSNQIKQNYSLIYDMAVSFAQLFEKRFNVKLNEDEISFIAIHLATYFSKNKMVKNKVKCILINEKYHNSSKLIKNSILNRFENKILISQILSLNQIGQIIDADLIITTEKTPINGFLTVQVNPIITNQDLDNINKAIESVRNRKILNKLLNSKLYFYMEKTSLESARDCIKFLGKQCLELGYIDKDYIKDVLLREKMSSTAFTDCLAIPHAANKFAKHSFIAVIQSNRPISWNNQHVNIVMLIGLAKKDMGKFNEAFDLIVSAFQSQNNVNQILQSTNFTTFNQALLQ